MSGDAGRLPPVEPRSLPVPRTPESTSSVRRLRIVGLLEGTSFLLLLGVAMPLKYVAHYPLAVQVVGSIHGLLFILFVLAVLDVSVRRRWWSPGWLLAAAAASVLPFGTFVFDGWLRRREIQASGGRESPGASAER